MLQFKPLVGGTGEDAAQPFDKGLQLVGFTSRECIPRQLYTDMPYALLPWPHKGHPSGLWGAGGKNNVEAARCAAPPPPQWHRSGAACPH